MKPRLSSHVASIALMTVLAALFLGSAGASAHAFDDVKTNFANLLSIDVPSAGWILGFIFIIVLMVILMWSLNDAKVGILIAGIGIVFVSVVSWWPTSTLIVLGLLVALLLIRPFGGGSSE